MSSITQRDAPRRRRMAAADRREAILGAALDAFAAGGYHETSLDAVAERAGISKALIYEHFSSKRELHRALLDTYLEELLGRILAATAETEPGEQRMHAGIDAFFGFVEERRGAWRMLFRNVEDPAVEQRLSELQSQAAAFVAERMAENIPPESGTAPRVEREVEMLAQQLSGAVQWLANWWDDHREIPRERLVEAAMDFTWVGMERLGAGEVWRPDPPVL